MRCAVCGSLLFGEDDYIEPCRICLDDAYDDGYHDGQLAAEELE